MAKAWRPMGPSDLPDVEWIAERVHPDFPESVEIPRERLNLFPSGCFVAADAVGEVLGYAISHPGRLGHPPALDSRLGALPADPDCLYLHDIALLAQARGAGLGAGLLGRLRGLAGDLGLSAIALVAVGGSAPYWLRHGFRAYDEGGTVLAAKLASYGPDARYLVGGPRRLIPAGSGGRHAAPHR